MLNENKIPLYKYRQLRLFFRFLKEYNYYNIFTRNFNYRIEYELTHGYHMMYYDGKYYEKTYKILIEYYLYKSNPIEFFDFFFLEARNDEFYTVRALWWYHILDLFNSKEDCGAFDKRDVKYCKEKLCIR